MVLSVEGLACVGTFGFGPDALLAAWRGQSDPAPTANTGPLSQYLSARALRQSDRFTRMALLGAYAAVTDAGLEPAELGNCGIVLASGYGPVTPTFDFLDSLLDFGEQMASPLAFSHSVHNIPAAVIAKSMNLPGPCCTVCQFESSVASALLAAGAWLEEGRVERVLFGAVDEAPPLLATVTERMVLEKPRRRPANKTADAATDDTAAGRRDRPLGEGAVFLCLSRNPDRARAVVDGITFDAVFSPDDALRTASPDMLLLSGAVPPAMREQAGVRDGSHAYGNLPVAQAFDLAIAFAVLRDVGGTALCVNRDAGGMYAGIRISVHISSQSGRT